MVDLQFVRGHNSALKAQTPGLVAVFTGATKGIGAATAQALIKLLNTPTIYIVGRSEEKFSISQQPHLQALNSGARIVFIRADITLLREVDRVCALIATAEKKVDLLFMSPGFVPVNGPHYTDEKIDKCMSLSHYGRIRFITNLVPLLSTSPGPRVLSVLAGGAERCLWVNDLSLASNYSMLAAIDHMTALHTLSLAHLAAQNPSVSFVHAHPGFVGTDVVADAFGSLAPGVFGALTRVVGRVFVVPVFRAFMAMAVEESGERQAFHATSGRYPSASASISAPEMLGGLYLVDSLGELSANWKLLRGWVHQGLVGKVWDHTVGVIDGVCAKQR
ncbi:hypothetical protein B0T22DRAFT_448846 [Podospora appendiculata]|uniref:NAD(P)-binding protein n=1 Tax=Podospora appendiculata TaxID=314037 RepID=A0AAE1CG73_9PEZI|nr:hypothetical protein B0T22DRAFT_448846 [Podospora appendiculata]